MCKENLGMEWKGGGGCTCSGSVRYHFPWAALATDRILEDHFCCLYPFFFPNGPIHFGLPLLVVTERLRNNRPGCGLRLSSLFNLPSSPASIPQLTWAADCEEELVDSRTVCLLGIPVYCFSLPFPSPKQCIQPHSLAFCRIAPE